MNRNVESHFSELPAVDVQRSIFDRSHGHKTTFNAGDVIPLYVDSDIMPGDSVQITTSKVVRAQTLLTPIMDQATLDTYWFFVPHRLVWNHWKQFCGENTDSAWIPQAQYQIPAISAPAGGFASGTLADYMCLNIGEEWKATDKYAPSALPFRAYALIMNEWFRDQNFSDPLNIPTGDANQTGSNGDNYITDVANGGKPFKAARYHDYFSSALPAAQKGPPVQISAVASSLPVMTGATHSVDKSSPLMYYGVGHSADPSLWPVPADTEDIIVKYGNAIGRFEEPFHTIYPSTVNSHAFTTPVQVTPGDTYFPGSGFGADNVGSYFTGIPSNLWAVGSGGAVSIGELRLAFTYQRFLEKMARGGSRYNELIKTLFGVTTPDARIQRPEYLGGSRVPLNVQQICNTAQTAGDFLGDLGAMSVTDDVSFDVEHSFTEYGTLMCVGVVRYDHSYQQGHSRMWSRKTFLDMYQPTFANLGEMPIPKSCIYATSETLNSDEIWGYQEAWAEYRYAENRISGEFRVGIPNSLGSWHLGDYYSEKPTLSDSWLREDKTNVDRCLAVTSAVSNQFFGDFYFRALYTRPMPTYSVPGLIDHN